MRWLPIVSLFAFMLGVAVVDGQSPTVAISELLPIPADGEREFIELHNQASYEINITGWTITDEANNQFEMPAWILPPGGRVVIWGGGEGDGWGPAWSRATAWNNGGDLATLRNAAGVEIDSLRYGPGGEPAPAAGESLQWHNGWVTGAPSPGQPTGSSGGSGGFTVQNVPPAIAGVSAPSIVAPGDAVIVAFQLSDDNGDDVAWSTHAAGEQTGIGNGSGEFSVSAVAPQSQGDWVWTIAASDGTESTSSQVTIVVRLSPLEVTWPAAGLQFPSLVPGTTNIESTAPFTLTNRGNQTIDPFIDISAFAGPTTVPSNGNVDLRVGTTTIAYDGPLTALPSLAPGESADYHIIIRAVPVPLEAGDYASTFTVTT